MSDKQNDQVVPKGKWQFDKEVSANFDDMLTRSIPEYNVMRETVNDIATAFIRPSTLIIDMGCSRGEAIANLVRVHPYARFVGLEISEPMLKIVSNRFEHYENVTILRRDLRQGLPRLTGIPSVILSILTIQFVPIEYRQMLIQQIYDTLMPGGVFIFVEKVLGNTARIDKLMVDIYLEMKKLNGYTDEQIARKKLSLEGVLVPVTAEWNIHLLKSAGFKEIDCFWRWMNFAGWIAIK